MEEKYIIHHLRKMLRIVLGVKGFVSEMLSCNFIHIHSVDCNYERGMELKIGTFNKIERLGEHGNDRHVLLPHQPPEVRHRRVQGACKQLYSPIIFIQFIHHI